jgi:hypothetical protein
MLSPGGGLGAQTAAIEKIKKLHSGVIEAINQFPTGSKEQQALLRVAQTLSIFSKEGGPPGGPPGGPVPPGIAAMNAPGAPPGGPPGMPGGPPGGPPMPPPGGPELGGAPA